MNKSIIIIFILVFSTPFWGQVTLKKAVKKGLLISNDLKSLSNTEQAQYMKVLNAKMNRLFKINGQSSYNYKSTRPSSPLPDKGSIGTHHTYDFNVKISQSLWDGGILKKRHVLSGNLKDQISNKIDIKKIVITGSIISSYLNYNLLKKKKNIQESILKSIQLHEKKIIDLYKEDLIKKTDLIETERLKISTINNIDEFEELIQVEVFEFQKLCGYSPEEIKPWMPSNKYNLKESIDYFDKKHPLMKEYKLKISAKEVEGHITQSQYLPQIQGYASLHYGKPGVDLFRNNWKLYAEGGINLKLKIFDWNQKRREKKITINGIEKLRFQRNELYWETSKNLKQLFKISEHIAQRLKNLIKIVKLSEEECVLKKSLYEENQISNIEYLRALTTKDEFQSQKQALTCLEKITKLKIFITSGSILEEI